jgi:cobalt-zinc-cadmium efflux system protein
VRYTGWLPADPIASIVTTILIVRGSWRLVRESVDVLLEAVPEHISLREVRNRLEGIAGVQSVHDLHVWTVTSGIVAMSAHAVVPEPALHQPVLNCINEEMRSFGIDHVTVQLERQAIPECVGSLHA